MLGVTDHFDESLLAWSTLANASSLPLYVRTAQTSGDRRDRVRSDWLAMHAGRLRAERTRAASRLAPDWCLWRAALDWLEAKRALLGIDDLAVRVFTEALPGFLAQQVPSWNFTARPLPNHFWQRHGAYAPGAQPHVKCCIPCTPATGHLCPGGAYTGLGNR